MKSTPKEGSTLELTEANFETEVVKSSQPVLVEFATGWSLPSMMLDGVWTKLPVSLSIV
jgi:thioredoxin-like negative regulator of GroEL